MPTKRTLSGTYIIPQDIHHQISSRIAPMGVISHHFTPIMRTASPIPADARPHVEYLGQFDLAQVIQWLKLCQESQTILTDMETTMKSGPLPLTMAQKAEESLPEEHSGLYPCTFCNKTFQKKGSWVRHEVSFHEPQKEWICPAIGCNRRFSTGNKFRRHHKEDHGCKSCTHDKDPSCIVGPPVKSAWGCGFCIAFLESWEIRVNHLETHFQEGCKTAEWDLSKVIQGLLLRPFVKDAWESLMAQEHGCSEQEWPVSEWSYDSFGELLTALRYDMNEERAAEVARLTYDILLPFNSEDSHLTEAANCPDGNAPFVATDESTLASDGNECLFDTGDTLDYLELTNYSTQNAYPRPDIAVVETTAPAGEYSAFQLGEDTLGVDWVLWPDCYEPGGTMRYTP
ncbi:hypothetical protein HD806DRAFT_490777 [Xylariaceae sp. AK1471]|nr:hypothetical protein HD806DRAFT_490777 [Xylariaceae sp. AK1471]